MNDSSHFTNFTPAPKPKSKRFKPKKKRSRETQLSCIERDGRCRWCGRIDDTLIGHHINAWGASGNDDPDNIITLCGRCHGDEGNGYLDRRVCNHPQVLEGRFLGASAGEADWKVYEPNKLLKRIMEENLV